MMGKSDNKKTAGIGDLTQSQVKTALVEEMRRDMPRIDVVSRLAGRWNRLEGRKLHSALLNLIGKPDAAKKADEILGDHR
jgi:ribosomal protein L14